MKIAYMHKETISILREAGYLVSVGEKHPDKNKSDFSAINSFCGKKIKTQRELSQLDDFACGYRFAKEKKGTIRSFFVFA